MFDGCYLRIGTGTITGCQPLSIPLLASLYALPVFPETSMRECLERGAERAPWGASHAIAPDQTVAAVSSVLGDVMLATPDMDPISIDAASLPNGSRAQLHFEALCDLWAENETAIPADIRVLKAFLDCDATDALQPVSLIWNRRNDGLTALERHILERLESHHGCIVDTDPDYCRLVSDRGVPQAHADTLLGHAQRNLVNPDCGLIPADDSLSVLSVRDSLAECEAAGAIVQSWLEQDAALRGRDIGIVIPDGSDHAPYLAEVFARTGLALSSLPGGSGRNMGAEAVLLFAQSRKRPAPAMALASLYSSPLMCWPPEMGALLAAAVMDGDFSPALAKPFTGKVAKLYELIRSPSPVSARQLAEQLRAFAQLLSDDKEYRDHVREARGQVARLIAEMGTAPSGEPDWDKIIKVAADYRDTLSSRGPYYLDGITVLRSSEAPARSFRKLLLLGFNDGCYPQAPAGNPFFLDSEMELIRERTGLALPSQAYQLRQAMDLFAQQLRVASEQVVIMLSERNREGGSLSPSSSLPLIARLIEGVGSPDEFVMPLDRAEGSIWDRLIRWRDGSPPTPTEQVSVPQHYDLGRDLLLLRQTDQGEPKPQSPSRLEKLLISPLAWVLDELGARHISWQPEQLTVALRGSLAHEVFELLFVPGASHPDDMEIEARAPDLLQDRIRAIAPFLQASAWAVERRTLEAEIVKAAKRWSLILSSLGAEVVGNEFWLSGEIFGHPVRGKADCLIRLPNGLPLIVDYKKSGTTARRKRLNAHWDLQVDLYRRMAVRVDERSGPDVRAIAACVDTWPDRPAVAYHLLNDGGVLVNGAQGLDETHVEVIEGDIAENARALIEDRFRQLRAGQVATNATTDEKYFKNKASLGVYALDASPLVRAFMREGSAADE
ncbi:PD-(D/E)XK nuclease family protein [Sphingopyxis granuli]|uniref:PD-(D/E)XK nuclease family protein n=1 Tax=Sphingopyxis granuli TaxID=267128 RepID=UPI001F53E12B|nr:PD-(D/E)XK nuclease family protein [Sphingopyxis granuli]UNK79499.1 PD-(D/E)XK nuclease family protein [Sphingopyxis granuli]